MAESLAKRARPVVPPRLLEVIVADLDGVNGIFELLDGVQWNKSPVWRSQRPIENAGTEEFGYLYRGKNGEYRIVVERPPPIGSPDVLPSMLKRDLALAAGFGSAELPTDERLWRSYDPELRRWAPEHAEGSVFIQALPDPDDHPHPSSPQSEVAQPRKPDLGRSASSFVNACGGSDVVSSAQTAPFSYLDLEGLGSASQFFSDPPDGSPPPCFSTYLLPSTRLPSSRQVAASYASSLFGVSGVSGRSLSPSSSTCLRGWCDVVPPTPSLAPGGELLAEQLRGRSERLCLRTGGDGNCLLHGVALAMWGIHSRGTAWDLRGGGGDGGAAKRERGTNDPLRIMLRNLMTGRDFKEFMLPLFKLEEEKKNSRLPKDVQIGEEEDLRKSAEEEYENNVRAVEIRDTFLGPVHVFALAQVLRTPIVVYEDDPLGFDEETRDNMVGIYLPVYARKCRLETFRGAKTLLYHRNERHFTALVHLETVDRPLVPLRNHVDGSLLPLRFVDSRHYDGSNVLDFLSTYLEFERPGGDAHSALALASSSATWMLHEAEQLRQFDMALIASFDVGEEEEEEEPAPSGAPPPPPLDSGNPPVGPLRYVVNKVLSASVSCHILDLGGWEEGVNGRGNLDSFDVFFEARKEGLNVELTAVAPGGRPADLPASANFVPMDILAFVNHAWMRRLDKFDIILSREGYILTDQLLTSGRPLDGVQLSALIQDKGFFIFEPSGQLTRQESISTTAKKVCFSMRVPRAYIRDTYVVVEKSRLNAENMISVEFINGVNLF